MEIDGSDGSNTKLKWNSVLEWGRGSGFKTDDRTVSRRHVELRPVSLSGNGEQRVRFVVRGKNPTWVHRSKTGEVSAFKNSETGELEVGDAFCVSAKKPVWFTCKDVEIGAENADNSGRVQLGLDGELADSLSDASEVKGFDALELESVDISAIDPVKEFGFVVIGEEFNSYPQRMIRDIKNWDWFLDEGGNEGSEDDDEAGENSKRRKRKRKKNGGWGEDDEEWKGESEEEHIDLLLKSKDRKVQKTPKYSTRSKDRQKTKASKKDDAGENEKNAAPSTRRKADTNVDVEDEEEDEADETLGGFIVDDEDLEEEGDDEEEEEEEEEEDFDEDELED